MCMANTHKAECLDLKRVLMKEALNSDPNPNQWNPIKESLVL